MTFHLYLVALCAFFSIGRPGAKPLANYCSQIPPAKRPSCIRGSSFRYLVGCVSWARRSDGRSLVDAPRATTTTQEPWAQIKS
jgi:hypothetical protein